MRYLPNLLAAISLIMGNSLAYYPPNGGPLDIDTDYKKYKPEPEKTKFDIERMVQAQERRERKAAKKKL